MKCSYCGMKGATMGCGLARCNKNFHYACAVELALPEGLTSPYYCNNHRHLADSQALPQVGMGSYGSTAGEGAMVTKKSAAERAAVRGESSFAHMAGARASRWHGGHHSYFSSE